MIIGVPREIKTHEYRVGMVPGGVSALTRAGHIVLLEKDAGMAAGYSKLHLSRWQMHLVSLMFQLMKPPV